VSGSALLKGTSRPWHKNGHHPLPSPESTDGHPWCLAAVGGGDVTSGAGCQSCLMVADAAVGVSLLGEPPSHCTTPQRPISEGTIAHDTPPMLALLRLHSHRPMPSLLAQLALPAMLAQLTMMILLQMQALLLQAQLQMLLLASVAGGVPEECCWVVITSAPRTTSSATTEAEVAQQQQQQHHIACRQETYT